MAKSKNEVAIKGRQTKLQKKTADDLVQIILKKDNVERNLNTQIKNLKGEVNNLSSRIKNLNSDMEGTMQSLESYKDKVETLQENNDSLKMEIVDVNARLESAVKEIINKDNLRKTWKIAALVIAVAYAISMIVIL